MLVSRQGLGQCAEGVERRDPVFDGSFRGPKTYLIILQQCGEATPGRQEDRFAVEIYFPFRHRLLCVLRPTCSTRPGASSGSTRRRPRGPAGL